MSQEHIDRDAVKDALKKSGLGPFVERLEKGIGPSSRRKRIRLSSGERQLISFARTLYMNPQILILDEVTSHIDTGNRRNHPEGYGSLAVKGRTTFIIAHRLSIIQDADQIFSLSSEGRIVERGRHRGTTYADEAAHEKTERTKVSTLCHGSMATR